MLFSLRSTIEAIKVALATHVRQVPQEDFADQGFELFSPDGTTLLPITERKAYPKPRDTKSLDLIVVHVTAVRGGFGVSKKRVKHWQDNAPSQELASQVPNATPLLLAHRVALWERFKNTPYHQIAARNGDCIANHPLSRHSWHGNAGNRGVGFSVDCSPDEHLDVSMIETARKSLEILIARVKRESSAPVIRITAHRCYSASRRNDPGAYIWQQVVKPVVALTEGVEIDYDEKEDGGLPIPKSWDAEAP